MGYLSSLLEPLEIAKNSVFWAKSRGTKRGKGASHHPKKYLEYFWPFWKTFLGSFPMQLLYNPSIWTLHKSIGAFQAKNRGVHAQGRINFRTQFLPFFIFMGHN